MKYRAGDKINSWEVLEYVGNGKFRCRCECGNIRDIRTDSLSSGNSKTCGHDKENAKKSWLGKNLVSGK